MTIHHCTLLNDDSWHWHFCVIMTRWRLKIQNPVNRDEAHGHKRSSTMKCLPPLALLTIVFLRLVPRVVANKWECDKRCGEKAFERCKKEQEENDDNRNLLDERYNYEHSELNSKNRFRGSTGKKTRQTGDILDFQIKMFWKAGFCVSIATSSRTGRPPLSLLRQLSRLTLITICTVARGMERTKMVLDLLGRLSPL